MSLFFSRSKGSSDSDSDSGEWEKDSSLVDERLESADVSDTMSFHECLSPKQHAEARTEIMLIERNQEAMAIRAAKLFRTNSIVIGRQESEIDTAFHEVNYYRAELAELCTNTTMSFLEKNYLVRYAHVVKKELDARKVYAKIVKEAALNDLKVRTENAYEDWLYRIQNDASVVTDLRAIRDNKELNTRLHDRKKNEFDYNRSKSILKADAKAFKAAWPNSSTTLAETTPIRESQILLNPNRIKSLGQMNVQVMDDTFQYDDVDEGEGEGDTNRQNLFKDHRRALG